MALSPMVYGEVRGGKLKADDPALLVAAFRCHEGKRVQVEVKRFRKARSLNQNAYYWKVVVHLVMEAMGEDDNVAAHEVLKFECNSEMRTIGKGEDRREYRHPLSTADLSTMEFEAYLERCRKLAAEFFGIYIPLPNEVAV
jgi:hypothetical protein